MENRLPNGRSVFTLSIVVVLAILVKAGADSGNPLWLFHNLFLISATKLPASTIYACALILACPMLICAVRRHRDEARIEREYLLGNLERALQMHDPDTASHSHRVADFTTGILMEMNIAGAEAATIVTAARLHDAGKVAVPREILQKEQSLTPEEWAIIQTHPDRSADLLSEVPGMEHVAYVARYHHERWDGRGYPAGLKGAEIPMGARIIAVADSFDAMTSARPYRCGMQVDKAMQILRQGRGEQWDPKVVNAFLCTLDRPRYQTEHEPAHARTSMGSPHIARVRVVA
ncbi:MAG: HD-GYP domain-containing protein [Chloroflexota bacterium]|nr:HD-GYP domain-containing protein [Chloroflexota bacterium]